MPPERIGGPYREPADPNAEVLERMRKKIEAEGKQAIELPPIRMGTLLGEFKEAILKEQDPDKIVFYAPKAGLMECIRHPNPGDAIHPDSVYIYRSLKKTDFVIYISTHDFRIIDFSTPEIIHRVKLADLKTKINSYKKEMSILMKQIEHTENDLKEIKKEGEKKGYHE